MSSIRFTDPVTGRALDIEYQSPPINRFVSAESGASSPSSPTDLEINHIGPASYYLTSGSGSMFGITEFGDLSDPPRKYLEAHHNNQGWRRSLLSSLFERWNALDALRFNASGTKVQQFSASESRTGAAGGSLEDSLEGVSPVPTEFQSPNDPQWVRTKREKYFETVSKHPNENDPTFFFGSSEVRGHVGGESSRIHIDSYSWTGSAWQVTVTLIYSHPFPSFNGQWQFRFAAASGDQSPLRTAADGSLYHVLSTSGSDSGVQKTFSTVLIVPPDTSLLFFGRLASGAFTQPYTVWPEDEGSGQLDAGARSWLYFPEDDTAGQPVRYSELLGLEDTIPDALSRVGAIEQEVDESTAVASVTTFIGGVTAESYDPISVEAASVRIEQSFINLTPGNRYRWTLGRQTNTIGLEDFVTDSQTGEFVVPLDQTSSVQEIRFDAPVGKERRAIGIALEDLGVAEEVPELPAPGIPILISPPDQVGEFNAAASLQIVALNTVTTYSAMGLPPTLSINTSTGLITGTHTATGEFSVLVTAENSVGSASVAFGWSVPTPSPPPAEDFLASNLSAAYGFRRLVAGYSGNLYSLRRASDNAEATFTVTSNYADVIGFLGGSNGFVTALYDQSGNGHTKNQTIASAQPPVSFGSPGARLSATSTAVTTARLEEANTLTSRAVVAVLRLDTGSDNGSGLVCNRNNETLEIRKVFDTSNTWDTFNYSSSIFVNGATTPNFTAGAFQVARFQRGSDATFENPHVIFSSQVSLARTFNGRFTEILFYNAAGAASAAANAATLKSSWGIA